MFQSHLCIPRAAPIGVTANDQGTARRIKFEAESLRLSPATAQRDGTGAHRRPGQFRGLSQASWGCGVCELQRRAGTSVWGDDKLSGEVFRRTVAEAQPEGVKRLLRLDKKVQQPHSPPIRWEPKKKSVEEWRNEFIGFLLTQGTVRG